MTQYEVKDADGNVVATFSSDSQGPFVIEAADVGGDAPLGGGGPGEEQPK